VYNTLVFAAAPGVHALVFFGAAQRRWGAAWGLRGIDDLAGLPLLTAGAGHLHVPRPPVSNSITRTNGGGGRHLRAPTPRASPDGFATTALKLSEYRKPGAGPWEEINLFRPPQRAAAAS